MPTESGPVYGVHPIQTGWGKQHPEARIGGTKAIAGMTLLLCVGCLDPSASGNLVPRTVDQDPSLPQIQFNDSTFHLETFGSEGDPVIIVLHGGPGSDYRSLLGLRNTVEGRSLEDRYQLVYWDQRGSGLSQRHDASEVDIERYDEDLDWLVDHFSPGRPVLLLGHSWGGMYASNYISNHPEKVGGAVLIEPGPLTGELFEEIKDEIVNLDFFSEWLNDVTWSEAVLSPDDHARADFQYLTGKLAVNAQPGYGVSESDLAPFWRHGVVAGNAVEDDGLEGGKGAWDFTAGLDAFETLVQFVASSRNTVIGAEFQRRQMRFFPDATLEVIPDSGHEVPWTHPDETLAVVFDYLDEIGF